MLAALGVFGTGQAWPDLLVAGLMASLALHGGWSVWQQATAELRGDMLSNESTAPAHGHPHPH
jgi:Co/Zn/Cd efflux system component